LNQADWMTWRDNLLRSVSDRVQRVELLSTTGIAFTLGAALSIPDGGRVSLLGVQLALTDAAQVEALWVLVGTLGLHQCDILGRLVRQLEFAQVDPALCESFISARALGAGTTGTVLHLQGVLLAWAALVARGGSAQSFGVVFAVGTIVLTRLLCLRLQGVLPLGRRRRSCST